MCSQFPILRLIDVGDPSLRILLSGFVKVLLHQEIRHLVAGGVTVTVAQGVCMGDLSVGIYSYEVLDNFLKHSIC